MHEGINQMVTVSSLFGQNDWRGLPSGDHQLVQVLQRETRTFRSQESASGVLNLMR